MRAGEKTEATTINLQWLMYCVLHREIRNLFGIVIINRVRYFEISKTHSVNFTQCVRIYRQKINPSLYYSHGK